MTTRQILFSLMLLFWVACLCAAPIRDHGIDPNNLGKGDWISFFQKVLGGKWNLLGTFQLTAGERLAVRITDAIPEDKAVVMADALKLSLYVPPLSEDDTTEER